MSSFKSTVYSLDELNDEESAELDSLVSLIYKITEFNNKILEEKTEYKLFDFYTPENIKKLYDLVEESKSKFTKFLDKRFCLENLLSMFYVESFSPSKKLKDYSYDIFVINRNVLMWSNIIRDDKFCIRIGKEINKCILELLTKIKKMFGENLKLRKKLTQKQEYPGLESDLDLDLESDEEMV
jgi:hypothetical protein